MDAFAEDNRQHSPLALLREALEWLTRDDPDWPKPLWRIGVPTDADLTAMRDQSRWFARRQPFYVSALTNRQNYVVGSGHRYTVRARSGQDIDAETLAAVLGEIEQFTEREAWQFRQQESQWRFDRDGEVFLRMFTGSDGRLSVRYIEPEQIATPPGHSGEFVRCGIEHVPGDVETPLAYYYRPDTMRPDRYERIEAGKIQHRKAGVDSTWPRGLPLCESAAINENLRRSWKLLRNITTVAGIQAAVAIVRSHARTGGGSVQEYATRAATHQVTDGQTTRDYQHFPPGAVVDLPPGVQYDFPAGGIDVTRFSAGVQAELRAIAAALNMPEFMLTADASNANYASTMVAEGPAVKMFERLQSQAIWEDTAILRRVIESAESAGRLPDGISRMVILDAEAPITQARNRLAEAQADQILLVQGVVSPQSVAARHGYDWQQERQLQDEAEEESGMALAGDVGDEPTGEPEAPTVQTETKGSDVQASGLNGAQISSMVEITQAVAAATMTKDTAKAVLQVSFPLTAKDMIDRIVDGIEVRPQQPQPFQAAA